MSLIVSIHDVTPALEQPVRALWALCREHGVTPTLLVVPQWHGAWPLEEHPEFVAWVRACAHDGAEVFLHGERHDEVGVPRAAGDWWRAAGRTDGEGEFLTLGYVDACERISRGLHRLQALGLVPTGFVPPAWLAREDTHAAVAAAGLAVSEDASTVRLHRSAQRLRAPAVRWSSRTSARARGSVLAEAMRWRWQRRAPVIRLALHPQDLTNPITAHSVHEAVPRWTRAIPVTTYAALDADR